MFKEQFSKMSAFRKRAFAVALSAAVVSTSFNIGTYAVEGGSSANGRVITAFEELPEDILYQYLPVGANESDINFPEELNVTLYSDTEEKKEEQSDDSGDIVIEEPEQENPSEEPTNQDDGTTGSGAGESGSDETVDTGAENTDNDNTEAGAGNTDAGAGNTDTGADTGSTETGTTEPGAGAGETIPEESPETSGETGGEGAGEGNTESGTSEEAANDEGSQESSQEEGGNSEPSDETAVDESAIQGIRSTAAAVIRAFKPVTVYAAENEDGGEESEGGESESAGEEGGEGENKENEGDTQNEGGAENTGDSGNNEQPEGNEGGEAAAPAEESGSSEDGNSDAGNSDAENTDNNTDEGITELSDGEARVLRDVNWKLVRDESAYSKFQAVLEGDVFVYEPKISEYGLKSDVELPKIRVTIVAAEETVSEDTVSEDTVSEDTVSGNSPAFSQMMIVGGVRVTVEAPEGVFPEGAVLHVKKLEGETLEKAESYVREDMGVASESSEDEDGEEESEEGGSSNLEMVAFDVTITDAEGNEIQPNTEFGEATVKFANVDLVGNYLDAQEGEDSENTDKSAELKVYHFEEGMESAEKLEPQVDGGDNAVTVNAGHFSEFGVVLSTQSAATAIKDKWDDRSLYLEFSGGDFYVDTTTTDQVITVSVNKFSTADYATIKVSGSTSKCLEIKPYGNDVPDVNVVLNGVTIDANYEKNNNNFGALTLDNCKTVLTLKKGKPNTLTNNAGTGHGIYLLNATSLVIEQENGADSRYCTLTLNGGKYSIYGTDGRAVTVNGGTINANQLFNSVNLTANGGLINMDESANGDIASSYTTILLNAGTHFLPNKQLNNSLGNSGTNHNKSYLGFIGGSIGINDFENNGVGDSLNGYYQYILNLSETYKNLKMSRVFGARSNNDNGTAFYDVVRNYNTEDTYTDKNGKLYLWILGVYDNSNQRGNPFSVELEGKKFVRKREKNQKLDKSFMRPYDKASDRRLDENTMIPYIPATSISVNVANLKEGANKLSDYTTLFYENGNKSVNGEDLLSGDNGLANQFWDINWSVSKNDGSNVSDVSTMITNNQSTDATLTLPAIGNDIYTLKAELTDGYGVNIVKYFPIKKSIYVNHIDVIGTDGNAVSGEKDKKTLNLSKGKQYIFALSGNRADRTNCYGFSVSPNTADHKDISMKLPASDDVIQTYDSATKELRCNFLKPGTYTMTATVKDGLGENRNYTETFTVKVVNSGVELTIDDWIYNGKSYKDLESNFHIKSNGTSQPSTWGTFQFHDLAGTSAVEFDDETGEYNIIVDRDDVSGLDINTYEFTEGDTLFHMDTISPNAGVYLAKYKHPGSEEELYYIFKISKKEIDEDDITCTPYTATYNGKYVSACAAPVLNGALAKQGINVNEDFTYTLSKKNEEGKYEEISTSDMIPDITEVGEYQLVVSLTKADNYKGTITVNPKITPKKITDPSIKIDNIPAQYYTGSEVKLSREALVIYDTAIDNVKLEEGVDFTASYTNNINIGTATVTIKGKGNYDAASSRSKNFTIKSYSGETPTVLYYGKGEEVPADSYKGKVTLKTKGGKYKIAENEKGPFSESFIITGTGLQERKLYFQEVSTNAILPEEYTQTVQVYLTGDMPLYYNGKEEKEDWYSSDVTLTTEDGLLISTSKSGDFAKSIKVEKTGNYTIYYKYNGAVLDVTRTASVNIDKTAPTGKIEAVKKSWNKFQGSQKTVAYTNEQKSVTLTGSDSDSKVKNIQYYITDTFYSGQNKVESAAKNKWETYSSKSKPGLSENSINYIYAKVTDNAGNSFYMSSEGIWYDTKAPKVTSAKATPKDTSTTVKVTATDTKGSGVKYVYVLVKKKDESKPTAKTVKSSGKRKELSKEDGKDDFEITGLTAKTGYVVYTVAEDFCENLSEVKETKITTKETSSSSSSGTGGKSGANGAAGAGGAGAGGSNSAKRGVSSDSAKNGKGGAGGSASENGGEDDSDKIRNKVPFIDDASEGVLTGREYTSGWDKIENETLAADAPAEIHIDMNGATVVPAKLLNDFANRDVTIYLEMGDGLVWAVNGLSFTSTLEKDIDFKVKKNTKNIPSKILTEVADVYPHTNLTLSHDGDFGFTAIMSLDMGADNSGMFGNLYYYNEEAGSLEFIDSKEIGGSGNVQFEFTHASDYTVIVRGDALTEKTAAALTVENSDSDMRDYSGSSRVSGAANVAKRSNHLWLLIISIISILLCGFILFMPDKKKWGK